MNEQDQDEELISSFSAHNRKNNKKGQQSYPSSVQSSSLSLTSSQRRLKHQQRRERNMNQDNLVASQSSIMSSPSNRHRSQVSSSEDQDQFYRNNNYQNKNEQDDNTLLLPTSMRANKQNNNLRNQKDQQDQDNFNDLSLAQLINNSMSMMMVPPTAQPPSAIKFKQSVNTSTQSKSNNKLTQDELLRKNLPKSSQEQQTRRQESNGQVVTTLDVYSQLKNIKIDIQRVRQAQQEMGHLSHSEESDATQSSSDEKQLTSALEQKYRFLVKKGKQFQTKDAVIVDNDQELPITGYLEMNNKLIEEAYTVSKRREYIQHHVGEVDMSILDTENEANANPFTAYGKAMEHIKELRIRQQAKAKNATHDEEDSDSRSADQNQDLTGINIALLTDDRRLKVSIPNYDNHYRLYFENPEAFEKQQELKQRRVSGHGKIKEEKREDLENKVKELLSKLNECEQVDVIGKIIPSFGDCLRDLQQTRLKYFVMLDRFKRYATNQLKSTFQQDRMIDLLGIQRDLLLQLNSSPMPQSFLGQQLQQVNPSAQQQQQRRKGTFGEASITNQSTLIQQQQKPNTDDIRDIQRIKGQLGDTESKLKDAQLQRLQEKVKGFAATEKNLRIQIQEIEKRDESMVTKLETAVCFGKIMITSRPLIVNEFGRIMNDIKFQAIDIPMQKQLSSQGRYPSQADHQQQQEPSLPERIDDSITVKLEVEFNELYNLLRSPHSLKEAGFNSRFALVTPDANLVLFADIHMTQEVARLALGHADFLDMGILIQNNRENKRMMFYKIVHHNLAEKKREVYLMSVFEDQIPKWQNCLDPQEDITACDRTYKIIKDRLLRAVIERSKRLEGVADLDQQSAILKLDGDDAFNWDETDDIIDSFSKLKENRKKAHGGGSDDEEYQVYEKQYQQHVNTQSKKLLEAGLNIDNMQSTPTYTSKNPRPISRTEDLQRELDNISSSVQQRVRSKAQAEHEKEDKLRSEEQQKRLRAKQVQNQEFAKAVKALSLGTTFLKYGAMGPPKHRHVFLQDNGKKLCWKDPGATSTKSSRNIVIKEITQITEGRDTKKFKRFKTDSNVQESLSFTLHTKKRTLDLEAANMIDKAQFLKNLNTLMQENLGEPKKVPTLSTNGDENLNDSQ